MNTTDRIRYARVRFDEHKNSWIIETKIGGLPHSDDGYELNDTWFSNGGFMGATIDDSILFEIAHLQSTGYELVFKT